VSTVNWQVTATSVYCDAVADEVTVMVYKDWSVKCTGQRKYGGSGKSAVSLLDKKSKQMKRQLRCEGLECQRVTRYREKLMSEEAGAA